MRLRHIVHTLAAGAALAVAAPTFAQESSYRPFPGEAPPGPDMRPEWREDASRTAAPYAPAAIDSRESWLADCRSRVSADNGVGGAVIGGVAGGLIGNRVAGRGNRTVGTIAGAAVGAIAGAAIDRAEDRNRAKDQCETYLDDYYARARYAQAYPGYGYAGGYGYVPGYGQASGYDPASVYAPVQNDCCQPARSHAQPDCVETVTYEYVDAPVPRARQIRRAPDKRVRIVPDKRIRTP